MLMGMYCTLGQHVCPMHLLHGSAVLAVGDSAVTNRERSPFMEPKSKCRPGHMVGARHSRSWFSCSMDFVAAVSLRAPSPSLF